jgi:uncharacterized membrane protein YgdD (TMEM256/DUF423 family)
MERTLVMLGSILMFIAVGAGAFGAHGLRPYFAQYPDLEATYETAVRYHMIHALALFIAAWMVTKWPVALVNWSGWLFLAGILLFSGSLYLLVFTRVRWLGAITPLGGVAFLAGWALLFIVAWRN